MTERAFFSALEAKRDVVSQPDVEPSPSIAIGQTIDVHGVDLWPGNAAGGAAAQRRDAGRHAAAAPRNLLDHDVVGAERADQPVRGRGHDVEALLGERVEQLDAGGATLLDEELGKLVQYLGAQRGLQRLASVDRRQVSRRHHRRRRVA